MVVRGKGTKTKLPFLSRTSAQHPNSEPSFCFQNPFRGKQIVIDGGGKETSSIEKLGPGGCRALATSIMGSHPTMPKVRAFMEHEERARF